MNKHSYQLIAPIGFLMVISSSFIWAHSYWSIVVTIIGLLMVMFGMGDDKESKKIKLNNSVWWQESVNI